MATTKVTFTLDDETIAQIRRLANRAHRPQSAIVREAVAHYAPPGKTSSRLERDHLLRVLDGNGGARAPARRQDRGRCGS